MDLIEEIRGFKYVKYKDAEIYADVCVVYKDCAIALYLEQGDKRIPVLILKDCKNTNIIKIDDRQVGTIHMCLKCKDRGDWETQIYLIFTERVGRQIRNFKVGDMVLRKNNGSAKEDTLADTGLLFWNYVTYKKEIFPRLNDIQKMLEWVVVSIIDNDFALIRRRDEKTISLISDLDTSTNIIEDAESYLKRHSKET